MADSNAIGFSLKIDDSQLKKLDEIDKKINQIATDSDNMAKVFTSAMTRMGTGADGLLKKLQAIQGVISGLESVNIVGLGSVNKGIGSTATQAEKAAASIAKAANAMNSMNKASSANVGVLAWQGLQKNIEQMEQRQKQLNASVKEYEAIMERIRSGKGGVVSTTSQQSYQEALKEIEANKQLIASYREKQQAIIATVQQQRQATQMAQALRNYESDRTSLPNQRAAAELQRLNEYYRELERTSAAAAAERSAQRQQRAQERAAQAAERAARRQEEANARTAQRQQNIREAREYRENANALNAYNRAMSASEALVTQRINKIAKLRQAEEMLRNASGNYATQLNRISQEIARLNRLNEGQVDSYGRVIRSQRNLINTSQQLTRQLALLFSVSQIEGYISKLIQVRGEFELQQTALASILQNKDEADQLFGQITELAVRSPFTIKELTTYSKSLAAYQVEYEDLYDTLKMLADVSSGLGVDMQRLILAFGQVKAANFLRGTETRQFTEAGINMLGELSKYYSELEGRIVSVTEVQDRQFKRMISFQDVEEVFKRLTSAGGMFYNMQEKQAETLRGQMMNLQDQIDLMLNDIGKSNQSTISTIISLVKSVIENWRTIAQVMEPIASILVLYLTATKGWVALVGNIPKIWLNIGAALEQVKLSLTAAGRAQQGFNKAAAANAWLAIGAVVATIIWEVVNAIQAANAEQKELNKTLSEGYDNAVTMSTNYKRLANTVTDATASYDEQEKALEELKRTYSEILPQHYLEADAIRAMKGNYDEATSAIYNYIQAKTQEKQLQVIAQNEGEDLSDTQQDLVKEMQLLAKSTNNYNMSLNEANSIINKIGEDIKKGLVKSSDDAVRRFKELYKISTGVELPSGLVPSELRDYYDNFVELEKRKEEVLSQTNTAFADSITRDLQEQLKVVDGTIKQMRSLLNTISHAGEVGEDGALITQKQVDDAKEKLIQITSSWGVESSKIQNLTGSAFEIKQATIDFTVSAYQYLLNKLANTKFEPDQQASVNKFMEDLQKRIDSFDATPFENYMSEIIQAAATANSISLDGVMDVFARTNETVDEYRKRLKGIIDQLQTDLEAYAKSPYLVAMWTGNPQAAAEAQKKLLVAQTAYSAVNVGETTGGKGNSENDRLKEQIRLIQDAGKEYEKYRKLYDEPMAQQLTEEAFTKAFKDVGLSVDMDFDVNGVIEGIRKVISTAGVEGQKIGNEAIAKLQTDSNTEERTKEVEEYRKQIDELFASLSNYQELEKLGLNKDLISQLFGIDVSSINDVQDVFEKIKTELKKYGNEGEKLISESEKKITDAQQKELQDRMKKYATYLTKQYSEIANIRIKLQKEMSEVDTLNMSDVQKQSIKQRLQDEANKQIQKLTWEDFKASDMYTQMFDDLDKVSTKGLDYMVERLEELKGTLTDLDPTELKEIIKAINDIKEEQLSRNPLKGIGEDVETALNFSKQRKELEEQITDEYEKQKELREQIPQQEQNVENARNNYGNVAAALGTDSTQAQESKKSLEKQEKILSDMNKDLSESEGKAKDLKKRYDEGAYAADKVAQRTAEFAEKINTAVQSMSTLVDGMNSIFNMSDGFNDVADSLISFGNNMANTVSSAGSAFASFATGNIFGGITSSISAIGGLFSSIGSLFSIGDKKKERQIQRQLELVEDLQHAYEKLEKAIDDAYSLDQYQRAYDMSKENLEQQRAALQESIRLEDDKKKTDKDRIKEWEQQIDDIEEQLEELAEEQFSTATSGILDRVLSAADEFTNAWLESFRSVGDGMDGLNENFQSMLEDMLKRQASMLITGTYLDRWKRELEKYINADDLELTAGEAKNWVDAVTSSLPGLNQALEEYFKAMQQAGFDLTGKGEGDTLTGLSKSISGLSEQQADALAALCESIRFFTSDSNAVLHSIYNFLLAPPAESPLMQEMRVQTTHLSSIDSLLGSVIKNSSGKGRIMRVEIV